MILEVSWDSLWTLSFGLPQLHGHGSWLVCTVALNNVMRTSNLINCTLFYQICFCNSTVLTVSKWRPYHSILTGYGHHHYDSMLSSETCYHHLPFLTKLLLNFKVGDYGNFAGKFVLLLAISTMWAPCIDRIMMILLYIQWSNLWTDWTAVIYPIVGL